MLRRFVRTREVRGDGARGVGEPRRGGELDVVARDGPTLGFVEVKARESCRFGEPAEAVTWRKQQRIGRLAFEYMVRHHLTDCPCRFDVVSVVVNGVGRPRVEVYRDAF